MYKTAWLNTRSSTVIPAVHLLVVEMRVKDCIGSFVDKRPICDAQPEGSLIFRVFK